MNIFLQISAVSILILVFVWVIFIRHSVYRESRREGEMEREQALRIAHKYPVGTEIEAIIEIPWYEFHAMPGATAIVRETNETTAMLEFDMGNHCSKNIHASYTLLERCFKIKNAHMQETETGNASSCSRYDIALGKRS